jgi:hypothetical protein
MSNDNLLSLEEERDEHWMLKNLNLFWYFNKFLEP